MYCQIDSMYELANPYRHFVLKLVSMRSYSTGNIDLMELLMWAIWWTTVATISFQTSNYRCTRLPLFVPVRQHLLPCESKESRPRRNGISFHFLGWRTSGLYLNSATFHLFYSFKPYHEFMFWVNALYQLLLRLFSSCWSPIPISTEHWTSRTQPRRAKTSSSP